MRHPNSLFCAVLALTALTGLTACQSSPPPAPPQQPVFGGSQPLIVAAESIELVEQYQSPGAAPNVEHEFDITPAGAVRQWVAAKLRADGTPGILQVVLLDGQVTRESLATTGGLKGLASDDQEYRYNGNIRVRIDYQPNSPAQPPAQVEVTANGTFTVPEGATLLQLEREMFDMVQRMISRVDLEAQAQMLRYMPGVVR